MLHQHSRAVGEGEQIPGGRARRVRAGESQPYPAHIALVRQIRMIDFNHGRISNPVRRTRRLFRTAAPDRLDHRDPGIDEQGARVLGGQQPVADGSSRPGSADHGRT